jgi:thiosulfate/3-mercaptopyruvate sulfurtransferase
MVNQYAHPEVLVETDWVAAHSRKTLGLRLVEVDVDTSPPTIKVISPEPSAGTGRPSFRTRFAGRSPRKTQFEALCSEAGITPDTTVILYGDNNNWFAAWALWQFKYYGHSRDVRLMNGGRKKWVLENRPLTTEKAAITSGRPTGPRIPIIPFAPSATR